MYLTAQRVSRVMAPSIQSVNAFCYRHPGVLVPPFPFVPDQHPGEYVFGPVQIEPAGNRVMSYLDIIAADHTSHAALAARFAVGLGLAPQEFPFVFGLNTSWFRFDADATRRADWRYEIRRLYESADDALARARFQGIAV